LKIAARAALTAAVSNEIEDLRDNAERCRKLAKVVTDERNRRLLYEMAAQLDEQADKLEEADRRNED
jgi:hypothetical protein